MAKGHRKWANPSGTATYYAWRSMRYRCLNPKGRSFHHYGGRGITICPQWKDDYDQFFADMGECPSGLTLEREDNEGGYDPGNCVWAPLIDQLNNQRRCTRVTRHGVTKTIGQWAADLGLDYSTLHRRLNRYGMSPEKALVSDSLKERPMVCGTRTAYEKGCRCADCREVHNKRMCDQRQKSKLP